MNAYEPGYPRYLPAGAPDPLTGEAIGAGRVYINATKAKTGKKGQFIDGVPKDVWEFEIGGYQICKRWLTDRRGRVLTSTDIDHYEAVVAALTETLRLMQDIDDTIPGWPIA